MGDDQSPDDNELIDRIYEAALDASRWPEVLDLLCRSFDAKGMIYQYDFRTGQTPMAAFSGMDESMLTRYQQRGAFINPYPTAALALPTNVTHFAHDVVAADIMGRTEFYDEFMRPEQISLHHLSFKALHDNESIAICIVAPGQRVFERKPEEAFARFDRLRPHLSRALALGRRLGLQKPVDGALEIAMEGYASAAFLMDATGRPLHVNKAGERMMTTEAVLTLDRFGVLRASRPEDERKLDAVLQGSRTDHAQMGIIRSRRTGRSFLVWCVASRDQSVRRPTRTSVIASADMPKATALLLVMPADRQDAVPSDLLQAAFGLSKAEARLVSALSQGITLAEYAAQSDVSPKTARNQLASVFHKTGTNRQSDLLSLVMRVLGSMPW